MDKAAQPHLATEKFHWPVRKRLKKNHDVKKLIISAVTLTKSRDTVSFPGGNEKPRDSDIINSHFIAPAQHELYFYILKRKAIPHVLQLSSSLRVKQGSFRAATRGEVCTVIDFQLLSST